MPPSPPWTPKVGDRVRVRDGGETGTVKLVLPRGLVFVRHPGDDFGCRIYFAHRLAPLDPPGEADTSAIVEG